MRKLSIITLSILAVVFIAGLYFYNKLGGFNDPEIKIVQAPAYVVAGKPYKGKMTGPEFGKLFEEAENHIEKKNLNGTVCGIFYNNPEKENSVIDAFVGIIIQDSTQKLPEGYSIKTVPARKAVQAHIKSHLLVAPFIYPDIEEFAKEQKAELQHVPALEIYPNDMEMIIEVPVK